MQKNEIGPQSYAIHQNLKWIKDLNIRPKIIKLQEENIGSKLLNISTSKIFLYVSPGKGNKIKNKQVGLPQTKKLLHCKGHHKKHEKATN